MKWLVFFLLISVSCSNSKVEAVCIDTHNAIFENWSINSKPKNTWNETDWLAKMIMTEVADSNDIESMYLVGAVAINHTTLFKYTLLQALLRPGAFSGLNREGYHWWKAEPTITHKKVAIELLIKGVHSSCSNVFAFCDANTLDNLANIKIRNWFTSFKLYKKIGDVSFFSYEKAVSLCP